MVSNCVSRWNRQLIASKIGESPPSLSTVPIDRRRNPQPRVTDVVFSVSAGCLAWIKCFSLASTGASNRECVCSNKLKWETIVHGFPFSFILYGNLSGRRSFTNSLTIQFLNEAYRIPSLLCASVNDTNTEQTHQPVAELNMEISLFVIFLHSTFILCRWVAPCSHTAFTTYRRCMIPWYLHAFCLRNYYW